MFQLNHTRYAGLLRAFYVRYPSRRIKQTLLNHDPMISYQQRFFRTETDYPSSVPQVDRALFHFTSLGVYLDLPWSKVGPRRRSDPPRRSRPGDVEDPGSGGRISATSLATVVLRSPLSVWKGKMRPEWNQWNGWSPWPKSKCILHFLHVSACIGFSSLTL